MKIICKVYNNYDKGRLIMRNVRHELVATSKTNSVAWLLRHTKNRTEIIFSVKGENFK
jgi:hypothetical protein